jgi:hypothetical protein
MIAIVYSVKNLSSSSREKLVASFKGGIDAGVWGAEAAANYESFKKEASSAANMNLNFYAMGGPGLTALKGLISKSNDIGEIKKIMEDYTGKLTADNSVPVDYLTGPIASLVTGSGDFDLAVYNKAIADLYLAREDYVAKLNRLRDISNHSDDYNLSEDQLTQIQKHFDGISKILTAFDKVASNCRSAFLAAHGVRTRDIGLTQTACNANDRSLIYGQQIRWPAPQPFGVTWWTEDNQFAPKRWLYISVTGAKLAESTVLAKDGTVLLSLKIDDVPGNGKKATGALEFSGLAATKFPLSLSMKAESGQEYTKQLNLTTQASVSLAVPLTATSNKLTVKPLNEILKMQDLKIIKMNLQSPKKLNEFQ